MSQQIPTHYAQQYASSVELLLQQRGSKLRDTVDYMSVTGAKAATPVEQIGKVEAVKRTTRYPSLVPMDTPHARPWVYPSDYDWNDLIDSIDKLRTVIDPQSSYVQNGTYALGRAMDREIVTAWFGDRKTDETGSTTTTWAVEGAAQIVAVNFGSAGNVGLTVAKLREAKRMLMAAEVDLEFETLTLALKAKQHDNLLAEIQVISLEFNDRPVLVEGKITRFLGFNFKTLELIAATADPYDRVAAYAKSGMCLAVWNDITSDISQRKDLAGLPFQVYVYGTFGATRKEAGKIVEIICNPA
jgi:hypothetical protein